MKILFICRGNVGRSQMAAEIFKSLNNKHEVLSAGTQVVSATTGKSVHGKLLSETKGAENVLIPLQDRGIDVSALKRNQINEEMVNWADKIVVMAEPETIPPYLVQSPKAEFWTVADPKGTTLDEHKKTANEIEGLVKDYIERKKL